MVDILILLVVAAWAIVDIWALRPDQLKLKAAAKEPVSEPPPKFAHPVKAMRLAEKIEVLQEILRDSGPHKFSVWETEFIGSLKERNRYSPKQLSKIDELIYRSYGEAMSEGK